MSTARRRDGTPERIIRTTERLIAEHGVDAVSIRDITTRAKVNTASIHYHFGSKRELVAAIVETRSEELRERRGELIRAIGNLARPPLRRVAEAMVLPTAEMAQRRDGRAYVGFIAAVAVHPRYAQLVSELTEKYSVLLMEVLSRATPNVDPAVRAFRYAMAKLVVNQAYGQAGRGVRLWVEHHVPGGDVDFDQRLVDVVARVLGGR